MVAGLKRLAKIAKPSLEVRIFLCHARHFFRVTLCQLRHFLRMFRQLVYCGLAEAWSQGLRLLRVYCQFCHETLKTAHKGGNLCNNVFGRHAQGYIRGAAERPANPAFSEVTLYDTIRNLEAKTGTVSEASDVNPIGPSTSPLVLGPIRYGFSNGRSDTLLNL
jgi:hypothetical protein